MVPISPGPKPITRTPASLIVIPWPATRTAIITIVVTWALRTKLLTSGGARKSRPRASPMTRAKSSPASHRSAGVFARHRSITAASLAGTSGRTSATRGAGSETSCVTIAGRVRPSNGGLPVRA